MTRWISILLLALASVTTLRAEENFSRAVRPDDFEAAGLQKLSPEELARLDALVREFKSGALAAERQQLLAAKAQAEKAEAAARAATEAAAAAQAKAGEAEPKPGMLERAKVLLRPGTRIEYTTLETRLATPFTGWRRGTIFVLENGQRWRAVGDSEYVTSPMPAPRVKIEPGVLGSFYMTFEGVRSRVKVESLDAR